MLNIGTIFILIIVNFFIVINYSKISKLINIYDTPDFKRKIHKHKTPLLGGLIFFLNIVVYLFLLAIDFISIENIFFKNEYELFFFILIGFILFFIGLYDDKKNLTPNIKLFLFFICLISLMFLNDEILISELHFSFINKIIQLGNFSYFFTVLCFLLFINACNMFDGINLQSSTFFLICVLFQFLIVGKSNFILFLIFPLISIIILNSRGKIFIGDGGIYLISFIIGYLFIKLYNQRIIVNSDTIFLIMMIPGYDLLRLFVERIYKKKHPFSPDKFHVHHLIYNRFGYFKTQLLLFLMIVLPIFLSHFIFESISVIASTLVFYIILIFLLKKVIIK
jgi:UDP-GlcNAc:undecaprenyl-phosphate GlcNAc-1-phosphate transferase